MSPPHIYKLHIFKNFIIIKPTFHINIVLNFKHCINISFKISIKSVIYHIFSYNFDKILEIITTFNVYFLQNYNIFATFNVYITTSVDCNDKFYYIL